MRSLRTAARCWASARARVPPVAVGDPVGDRRVRPQQLPTGRDGLRAGPAQRIRRRRRSLRSEGEAVTTISVAANLAGFPAIGELADGTVLVVDVPQETVWALTGNGTAKQLLKFPVSGLNQRCADAADGQECADQLLQDTVVDSHGTVYALEHYTGSDRNELEADHYAPLSTLLTADSTAGGASARITLPRSIPGVPGDPAALRTLAIAPADNGVYALVETPDGDFTSARYVLHIHAGTADVVAAQRTLPGGGAAVRCSFQGSASPTALSCLPNHAASLAFGDGRLLVAGWLDAPDNASASQTANVVIGLGAA